MQTNNLYSKLYLITPDYSDDLRGKKGQSRLRTLSLQCRGQLLTGTAFGISFVAVLETLISAKIAEQRQAASTSFREDTVAG